MNLLQEDSVRILCREMERRGRNIAEKFHLHSVNMPPDEMADFDLRVLVTMEALVRTTASSLGVAGTDVENAIGDAVSTSYVKRLIELRQGASEGGSA